MIDAGEMFNDVVTGAPDPANGHEPRLNYYMYKYMELNNQAYYTDVNTDKHRALISVCDSIANVFISEYADAIGHTFKDGLFKINETPRF